MFDDDDDDDLELSPATLTRRNVADLRSLIHKEKAKHSPTGLFVDDDTPLLHAETPVYDMIGYNDLEEAARQYHEYCENCGDSPSRDWELWDQVRMMAPKGWYVCHGDSSAHVIYMLQRFGIELKVVPSPTTILSSLKVKGEKVFYVEHGAVDFTWRDASMRMIRTHTQSKDIATPVESMVFFAAETVEALKLFINDIHNYTQDTEDTIMVFKGGWQYSRELRESLRGFTWDDIILPAERKETIRGHVDDFFKPETRAMYEEMGVPYKRGFLLAGPPGCGKSLISKIIANTTPGVNFIYVITLHCPNMSEERAIEAVFEKARASAPCIVCFEDLDSQLDRHVRTTFLNAMDGFEANEGVLTIATTNNPDEIDPALVNRPSRFDTKWVFSYPEVDERQRYLTSRMLRACRLTQEGAVLPDPVLAKIKALVPKCLDFSYAMLQEMAIGVGFRLIKNFSLENVPKYLDESFKQCAEQVKLAKPSEMKNQMKADRMKEKAGVV